MTKIKRFIECYIPTETCNLKCHYCYIAQQEKFNNKLAHFSRSLQEIRQSLSKKRLGGICLLNLCAGGETLLSNEVIPLAKELIAEGHYVMIVTNGTISQRFKQISLLSEYERTHLFIKFSLHYLEMKRLDYLEKFAANVNLMKQANVSFTVEVTPSDELVPYIDELKDYCIHSFGALCHVTIARNDLTPNIDVLTKYDFNAYIDIWKDFDSELFDFKKEIFYKKRNEFCYAGAWSISVNLETGVISQCYNEKQIGNIYELDRPITFEPVGNKCSIAHCYNGHVFLALGLVPELDTPTYAELRNRVCNDGTEWLQPEMKEVMQTKLSETNKEYSALKKRVINRSNGKKKTTLKDIKRKIRKVIK